MDKYICIKKISHIPNTYYYNMYYSMFEVHETYSFLYNSYYKEYVTYIKNGVYLVFKCEDMDKFFISVSKIRNQKINQILSNDKCY